MRRETAVGRAVRAGRTESAGGRVRFTASARRAALDHIERRRGEGVSLAAAARETGVPYLTLRRWRAGARSRPAFRQVAVVAPERVGRGLVVVLPSGLRVEGLDVDGVAELARRLQ
jgi:hypothetical protein